MGQAGGDPDLAEEALRLVTRPRVRPEDLDRHLARVLDVFGQIHRGRATPADLLLDQVAIAQGLAQTGGDVGHNALGFGPRTIGA